MNGEFMKSIKRNTGDMIGFLIFIPIALVITIVDKEYIVAVLIALFAIYLTLDYINSRMKYDIKGITFCNFIGQKIFISWDEVIDVSEDEITGSRGRKRKVVIITYRTLKSAESQARRIYDLRDNGAEEFLEYYQGIVREMKKED